MAAKSTSGTPCSSAVSRIELYDSTLTYSWEIVLRVGVAWRWSPGIALGICGVVGYTRTGQPDGSAAPSSLDATVAGIGLTVEFLVSDPRDLAAQAADDRPARSGARTLAPQNR